MSEEKEITQMFLMKEILGEVKTLRDSIPSGELKTMQGSIDDLKAGQKALAVELKSEMSDIKKKLLDPDDGVIVKVNENTKFRLHEQAMDKDYIQFTTDIQEIKTWRLGVNKALWIVFGTILAIIAKMLFGIDVTG
jgi:hypothetical protein